MDIPSISVSAGILLLACFTMSSCSAVAPSGSATGFTCLRIGDSESASITESHLSGGVSAAIATLVDSTNLDARSAGNFAVGSGGREASLRARISRFSSRESEIDFNQSVTVFSDISFQRAFNASACSRTRSSFESGSAAATTDRMSRSETFETSLLIASARSNQYASFIWGSSCSAIFRTGPSWVSGFPSLLAFSLAAANALLTAERPPFESCSAIIRCSSGRELIRAIRCRFPTCSFADLSASCLDGLSAWDLVVREAR